ncbi:hypothetical protein FC89_GL001561 [Liquorilactobacillus ghanensis DSM 18630]|uniref:Uncharacterized protein n=1 Tax=Liquorilactobacillus ghanensis DSM 18630 TaxID=1423750 RepID=A0A0R1VR37_9LACO|nr:hypothetical protein FC89_GL001561 [Liquorilactobacillus ghanensis DSM 18630]
MAISLLIFFRFFWFLFSFSNLFSPSLCVKNVVLTAILMLNKHERGLELKSVLDGA